MGWERLLEAEIQSFIRTHEKEDVRALALKKPPQPDWPYKDMLDQIISRQKAAKKMPTWLEDPMVVFPAPDVMEQASSMATARFKASLMTGESFADLTGGTGQDCLEIARHFKTGLCCEHDPETAERLRHNLKILGGGHVTVHGSRAEDFIQNMEPVDWVYCDPARRVADGKGKARKGLYSLHDCSPDIVDLLPALRKKSGKALIKTSPMLDISRAVEELACVEAVYVIEYEKDCKECLYVLDLKKGPVKMSVHAVSLNAQGQAVHDFSFDPEEEKQRDCPYAEPRKYLYEPGPALQKAGCSAMLALHYNLEKLHPNTQLYTSDIMHSKFPGRVFEIQDCIKPQKKDLKAVWPDLKANISVRNFPIRAEDLQKKLGTSPHSDRTIFACTLYSHHKVLLLCKPIERF